MNYRLMGGSEMEIIDEVLRELVGNDDDLAIVLAEYGIFKSDLTDEEEIYIEKYVYQCETCGTWQYVDEECCD